jgi:hypothetical protein
MHADRDDYCVEHLSEALARDERVSELGLTVTLRGDRIFGGGTVSTPDRQRAVADVVHELMPEAEVHNETTVVGLAGIEVEQL